jgi:hypothetical protein
MVEPDGASITQPSAWQISIASLLLGQREDRDPITAYRPKPKFLADLNGDGSDAKPIDVGIANQFLEFQCGWLDLYDV